MDEEYNKLKEKINIVVGENKILKDDNFKLNNEIINLKENITSYNNDLKKEINDENNKIIAELNNINNKMNELSDKNKALNEDINKKKLETTWRRYVI